MYRRLDLLDIGDAVCVRWLHRRLLRVVRLGGFPGGGREGREALAERSHALERRLGPRGDRIDFVGSVNSRRHRVNTDGKLVGNCVCAQHVAGICV